MHFFLQLSAHNAVLARQLSSNSRPGLLMSLWQHFIGAWMRSAEHVGARIDKGLAYALIGFHSSISLLPICFNFGFGLRLTFPSLVHIPIDPCIVALSFRYTLKLISSWFLWFLFTFICFQYIVHNQNLWWEDHVIFWSIYILEAGLNINLVKTVLGKLFSDNPSNWSIFMNCGILNNKFLFYESNFF